MAIRENGPGQQKYPTARAAKMKMMPDGNPYPYEMAEQAEDGASDREVADKFRAEQGYSPEAQSNEGDDGSGGSGKI